MKYVKSFESHRNSKITKPVNEELSTNPYFIDNIDFLSKQREDLDAFMSELMSDFLYVQPTDDAKENSIEENIDENIEENIEEKQEL
jgi:hypothetical protein